VSRVSLVMNQSADSPLSRTPLHERHLALGARMVPFAGWEMPVEYSGISAEHMAVRTRAGLFDVSHMGRIEIRGDGALPAVQQVTTNDASRLSVGQAEYSVLTTPQGTCVDDILVYRMAADRFLLVVNAANTTKDYEWITGAIRGDGAAAQVEDRSAGHALLALQGPAARDVLQSLTSVDLTGIRRYWFAIGEVAGATAMIARTGYTGEDGFEVFVPPGSAAAVWDAILDTGKAAGVVPVGLGARDTLRLEAGMRLYGNEIDETTSVLEADLGWVIDWTKPGFIGREALWRQRAEGLQRRLVGFEMLDRGIARHGYAAYAGDGRGVVTSGTSTPFLKKAVGLAYLPIGSAVPGTPFEVDIRGRRSRAQVVPLPFYKRPRS
jgi:aminomethyltransferase